MFAHPTLMMMLCFVFLTTTACKPGTTVVTEPQAAPAADTTAQQPLGEAPAEPAAPAAVEAPAAPTAPGQYVVNGWTLDFSEHETRLTKGVESEEVFSEKAAKSTCSPEGGEEWGEYKASLSGKLLFVTDTMFGYEYHESGYCGGASAYLYHNLRAVRPGQDLLVLSELTDAKALKEAIDGADLVKKMRASDRDLCLSVPEDVTRISAFAIKQVKGEQMEVMIALRPSNESCRIGLGVINVWLPVKSPGLLKELNAAQAKGLLLEQLHPGYAPHFKLPED